MKSLQDQSHFGATGNMASLQSTIQDSESVQDGLINWQVDDYCTRTDRRAIKIGRFSECYSLQNMAS